MRRHGFALLPALWLVVFVGGIVLSQAARSSDSLRASGNRVLLTAAEWARNACLSYLRAQLGAVQRDSGAEHSQRARRLRTGALEVKHMVVSDGVSCEARFVDLGAAVNANTADSALLVCLLRDEIAVARVLARRPFPNEDAIAIALQGSQIDSTRRALLAVHGPNRFNVNSAPLELLECLDEVGRFGALAIAVARSHGREFATVAEFVDGLPLPFQAQRSTLAAKERLTTEPPLAAIVVVGFAGEPSVESTLLLLVRLRGTDVDLVQVEEF
ncbi:MAG: hypothetical protein ACT4P6_11085 [Gemmatimonadaceae bacterium]